MSGVPGNLRTTAVGRTTVDLAWDVASGAPTGYKVYRDTILVATLGAVLAWQDTGRAPETTYSYTVSSTDAVPTESAQSAPLLVTTDSAARAGLALQAELNRLANGGTYRTPTACVGVALAANQWAGTTGLALQGALNAKAGTTGKAETYCLNQIAGTLGQMYAIEEAARRCV